MHSEAAREQVLAFVADGRNDCEIARLTGIPRSTVRDIRVPRGPAPCDRLRAAGRCPRCWRRSSAIIFTRDDYAELLGLYLGDGCISPAGRVQRLRIFLDARYPGIVDETAALLARCFPSNRVGRMSERGARMVVLSTYSLRMACLFPQHGAGKKHERSIRLEDWQVDVVKASPWPFLRGCIRSDGCAFVNRTGPYEYLTYDFCNSSMGILDIFVETCELVGVEVRRNGNRVRINRRSSVAPMRAHIGLKG